MEATLEIDLEVERTGFVGSLDLEGFLAGLPETLRTCLAHGHGASPEAEPSLDPSYGFEGLGLMPPVPGSGRCELCGAST